MQLPLLSTGQSAIAEGAYRYSLERCWDPAGRCICWIMCNPSTADATHDDATIRRCLGFSRVWGFGKLEVVNVLAYRATDPADVREVILEHGLHTASGGERNVEAITQAFRRADTAVAAWGGCLPVQARPQIERLKTIAFWQHVELMCLGVTKGGAPRHPLMVRKNKELERWL